jgi:hypothetical protein
MIIILEESDIEIFVDAVSQMERQSIPRPLLYNASIIAKLSNGEVKFIKNRHDDFSSTNLVQLLHAKFKSEERKSKIKNALE